MSRKVLVCLFALLVLNQTGLQAGDWRVGQARIDITPVKAGWLAGYASRKKPAEGTTHPLWAKALVFEDKNGTRAAIVTTDLIGLTREISDAVGKRVAKKTGIAREQILLNSSHTHSGPVVRGCASLAYGFNVTQQKDVDEYAKLLEEKLTNVIVKASQSLADVTLAYGEEQAIFARNRRGRYNPDGPVDHTVPVLRVNDTNGKTQAILFGYACHNTTIALFEYCGDYAGFAQVALEKKYPGTMALFMMGCGGDANPHPRGTLALAEQHGNSLADSVVRAMGKSMGPVKGPLKVKFQRTNLAFVDPPSKSDLVAQQEKGDVYTQRLNKYLLNQLEETGSIKTSYPFSVQVIFFGDDLTLIGLGGETVIDYSIRLHEELSDRRIWVAGYCNEVFAYVPSERVLKEGGYEGGGAMKYFGFHGPFKPGLEDRIIELVHTLMKP
ncbi:MAG: neutral/alkaline non-lysosomal ceramidase N-terminal domain-containing protein [Planctomycetes bacterium]|nr:neutral/alkaline non-lysosomal ceramidase N-terminal domain-containing protein [Planctomycetota bacterium]MCH9726951.1 neutral/alkaline non-lysosomal ceramidase N-terminal domain-containing protein [Planctomycetota bacterium]MCH9775635.1 neutral/alkaline non-lysosomal ceramidase N-terminal domain-containing protein [Planctomycetota bacterium]MCH9789469.1 neutral/alkaline non-lysosomal ceramidase N-terminal domain-containing protein [Planctomycetota bacterium]